MPEPIRQRIESIRRNRTSGAVQLAIEAAGTLILAADTAPACLPEAARALMQAQPTMAPVINVAGRALASADPRRACREFISAIETAGRSAATHAAALIVDGATVLTHSSSSSVLQAFRTAQQAGKRFRVICTESRPLREGVTLAEQLGRENIPTTLILDAAAYFFLPQVQLVLVGADSVSNRALVNKAGTSLVALAAAALKVPMYAICTSEKFLPPGYELPPEEAKDPREILERPVTNVTVVNYYFDETPLEYLTGIVTEEGILPSGHKPA